MIAILFTLLILVHDLPRGCHRLAPSDVAQLPHGYLIIGLNRFVTEEEASDSGDDYFWVCTTGAEDVHLFVPIRYRGEKPA